MPQNMRYHALALRYEHRLARDFWRREEFGELVAIRDELKSYGNGLAEKPEIIALNKSDSIGFAEMELKRRNLEIISGSDVFVISGIAREGTHEVLSKLWIEIERHRTNIKKSDCKVGFQP